MKKILTKLSILLLIPTAGMSQLSIVASDLATTGDNIVVSRAIDFQIDFLATGPDYQWNFPEIALLSQTNREHFSLDNAAAFIKMQFGPFAPTKYKATYYMPYTDLPLNQFGTILPMQIGDVFQYTQKKDAKLTLVGYSASINGQGIPIKSDTIETKYIFPLDYGDSYTSKGYTKLDLSFIAPAKWQQKRFRETEVDGWGTITTPFGTYETLRVHHRVEETDSLEYDGTSFGLNIPVMHEYEWLTKEEKIAVLKVTTSEVLGNETIISIEYIDSPLSSNKLSFENQVVVYPNPTEDELIIRSKDGKNHVSIFSIDGVLVDSFEFSNVQHHISTAHLANGSYILSINNNGISVNKHFVKK